MAQAKVYDHFTGAELQPASPYANPNTYGKGGQFRIVRENRGDLVTGFRVQVEKYGRRGAKWVSGLAEQSEFGPYWANIGRKLYSIQAAREYRAFLERHNARADVSVEVIE